MNHRLGWAINWHGILLGDDAVRSHPAELQLTCIQQVGHPNRMGFSFGKFCAPDSPV